MIPRRGSGNPCSPPPGGSGRPPPGNSTSAPDVTFHDGTTTTSEDTAFSIHRAVNSDLACDVDGYVFGDERLELEVVDEHRLTVTTTDPDPILPLRLSFIEAVPRTTSTEATVREPVGTGSRPPAARALGRVGVLAGSSPAGSWSRPARAGEAVPTRTASARGHSPGDRPGGGARCPGGGHGGVGGRHACSLSSRSGDGERRFEAPRVVEAAERRAEGKGSGPEGRPPACDSEPTSRGAGYPMRRFCSQVVACFSQVMARKPRSLRHPRRRSPGLRHRVSGCHAGWASDATKMKW
ncbi:ABC transporter substrate-binding protein [Actinoalloteichus spitiensis]|uniref:ABC transporter substrate-binding protein n=1 Tax=Actinoalloteichus spitiensis TaxID=252394 RepID=UPI001B7FE42D